MLWYAVNYASHCYTMNKLSNTDLLQVLLPVLMMLHDVSEQICYSAWILPAILSLVINR